MSRADDSDDAEDPVSASSPHAAAGGVPSATGGPSGEASPASLSWPSFLLALAVVLAVFVGLHPIWEPLDLAAWDRNILWSYAPIPVLVAALLAAERKLSRASFLLETMKLTAVKFAVTYVAAHSLWVLQGAPEPVPATGPRTVSVSASDPFGPREPPPPSAIDPGEVGRLTGRVVDSDGGPAEGALVRVAAGLEGLSFEVPDEGIEIVNDGRGFRSASSSGPQRPVAVVATHRLVRLVAGDGRTHTAIFADDRDRWMMNVPVLPERPRPLMFERDRGLVTLRCSVHGAEEEPLPVAIVSHPFVAWTDASGGFVFDEVPSGELELAAWIEDEGEVSRPVRLEPGGTVEVVLRR